MRKLVQETGDYRRGGDYIDSNAVKSFVKGAIAIIAIAFGVQLGNESRNKESDIY